MARRALAALAILAACGETVPSAPATYTILDVRERLDLRRDRLETSLTVEVTGGACLTVPGEPAPLAVRWDGEPVPFTVSGAGARFCGPGPGKAELALDHELRASEAPAPFAGFVRRRDRAGRPFIWLNPWLTSCVGPCLGPGPVPIEIEVLHAATETVLCPGERTPSAESTRCTIDRAAPYSAWTVAASPAWNRSRLLDHEAARVDLYQAPDVDLGIDPAAVGAALDVLVPLLGPLPWGRELRIGVAPIDWTAYEPPAMVFVSEGLRGVPTRHPDWVSHALLHELAHQWAGDLIAPERLQDLVWKEAVAEYLAYRVELLRRPAAEARATRAEWKRSGLFAPLYPDPIEGAAWAPLAFTAYGAGPMILLLQLEDLIGEEAVQAAVLSFLAEPGLRRTGDLRAALEAAGGADLEAYWSAWVEGAGEPARPEIRAELREGRLLLTQTQANAPLPLAITLELRGSETRRAKAVFAPAARSVEVEHGMERVDDVELDPDDRALVLQVDG